MDQMGTKSKSSSPFHIAMYPWFAFGHLGPFIQLSNKLAERGHKISFFLPTTALPKLQSFNLHPNLIQFFPLKVPHVEGLPPGAETTADVPFNLQPLIMTAMDLTEPELKSTLHDLKPDMIFFDFTYWVPSMASQLDIKSVLYCCTSAATIAYLLAPASSKQDDGGELSSEDLMHPPPDFPPSSSMKLHLHEARVLSFITYREYGCGVSFSERITLGLRGCDAISFRTSRETEGMYCEYIEKKYGKPVMLSGPILPEPPSVGLDEKWAKWLDQFKPKSVIFCSFGSECFMKKDQYQELLLGFELTGMPFLVALKPPAGAETTQEALPEGFEERVSGRGVVEGGWVQQQLILGHPSVGCFLTHCGLGSMTESLVNDAQLVLLPYSGDQFVHARLMSGDLKIGLEVERREEDGWFTKESVSEAVKMVMDEDNKVGKEVRENRLKLKKVFQGERFESDYLDEFVVKLQALIRP
ncbi:cyanidin 3-O-galactoside 2''-O-xylosyltransferase FGGT1-like [Macadamia integrifolia]|uniref:cyanidin 3-O-galactoside 2''-O-xylosyltransferase FGGT1-like n=1 Tax=Macadamia integrifolia TaxID=60698 RepID=UPI001C4FF2C0|nr:cyanidin 3-O-galactoside 2''-O-xylosyltransferase FGGT1-like [Macadamia integrifolia]